MKMARIHIVALRHFIAHINNYGGNIYLVLV